MLARYESTKRVMSWLLLFEATAGSFKKTSEFDKQSERRDPQFLVVVVEVGGHHHAYQTSAKQF